MERETDPPERKQGGSGSEKGAPNLAAPVQTQEFWTILINSLEITAGPMGHPKVTVKAQFIYVTHMVQGPIEDYVPFYLTAPDKPIEITVPPWFFEKSIDRISYKDAINRFVRIFKNTIDIVPPRPVDVPLHKVPPIKRRALLAAYKKMTENQYLVPPPGKAET